MLKQYVLVPKKFKPGKAMSQVAHATFLALEKEKPTLVHKWKENGMCVIVLECKDISALDYADEYLSFWKIVHHKYIDESEALTPTVLATGIIEDDKQFIFSKFNLYQ